MNSLHFAYILVLHLFSSIIQHDGAFGIIPSTNSVYRSRQDEVWRTEMRGTAFRGSQKD